MYVETSLHLEKSTVGVLYGVVDSLVRTSSKNGIVHGDRYRAVITDFVIPQLSNRDVEEL